MLVSSYRLEVFEVLEGSPLAQELAVDNAGQVQVQNNVVIDGQACRKGHSSSMGILSN